MPIPTSLVDIIGSKKNYFKKRNAKKKTKVPVSFNLVF